MDNSFIPQAIEVVAKAIDADNAKEYEKALSLYRDALARFTTGLKYEKNEPRKKLILDRVEGYMKRAEELRDYIAKQNELEKNGGGGSATRKAGDGKDDDDDKEQKKLRGALAGAIVSEKPNIKWEDVAGLDNAKESLKEVRSFGLTVPCFFVQLCVCALVHLIRLRSIASSSFRVGVGLQTPTTIRILKSCFKEMNVEVRLNFIAQTTNDDK
mmetsp:Transcript_2110/g.5849  ORF Transcript_2110/g.5849 Transcript_2110/m.5849 type:complete len:213 (-) Transcript_2110:45-683(-)